MDTTATQIEPPETIDNPTPEPEKVANPEAVLAKNRELLKINKTLSERTKDFERRLAEFEAAEAKREEDRLAKKGDFDTWREKEKEKHAKEVKEWRERYQTRFYNSAEKDLRLALIAHDAFEDEPTVEALSRTVLAKHIEPHDEDGETVWRTKDGEMVKLDEYILSLQSTYGRFFKANNKPGGDAPGNTSKVTGTLHRSKMTVTEKTAFVKKHGQAAYNALPM